MLKIITSLIRDHVFDKAGSVGWNDIVEYEFSGTCSMIAHYSTFDVSKQKANVEWMKKIKNSRCASILSN